MSGRRVATLGAVLLAASCAPAMTPEQKMSHELWIDAAYQCESTYHTIHVDAIGLDGNLSIHADADSRGEYRPFIACYHEGIKRRVEEIKKAGKPVPEALNNMPGVDLD